MLNAIWTAMVLGSIVAGALHGRLDEVSRAMGESAGAAVTLALGLVGVMTFWLGLVRVLHVAGALSFLGALLRPVMRRLFPGVPSDHPAMGMMILNMVCNIMGLGNAATPFGLRAMVELNRLNPRPGTASNAMVMFLAINTSGMAVLPTGMMALRAALGSDNPGAIFLPTLLATSAATLVGVSSAWLLGRLWPAGGPPLGEAAASVGGAGAAEPAADDAPLPTADSLMGGIVLPPVSRAQRLLAAAATAAFFAALGYALWQQSLADSRSLGELVRADLDRWTLLILVGGMLLVGLGRGVPIYQAVVEGGRDGFQVALRVMPFLVAILTATGMLRASGGLDTAMAWLDPLTRQIGMPVETLPMALLRPLSGQGAYGVAADIMRAHGPDSLVGQIASTMMGSTETTFYVLALYLGAVGIMRARHTLAACLLADLAGMLAAVWTCRWLLT